MPFPLRIAWRYLFAKKKQNAINIVSAVSAVGVAVATAAMICVLSVMNGFGTLVEDMFSLFDPDLRITATTGKSFSADTDIFREIADMHEVEMISETIEETALLVFSERQMTAKVKGVDEQFEQLTGIDSIIIDGEYMLFDGAFERAVMGRGLATRIGIGAHFVSGMRLYAPKRTGHVNMLNPERSLNKESLFIAGVFAVNQLKYDDQYMLVSLPLAQRLFDFQDNEVTALELKLRPQEKPQKVAKKLQAMLGDDYQVRDRYHQQEDFFRIYEVEKLLTILLLTFIILIAALNIIGTLSMQMLDKTDDIQIFHSIGATQSAIQRIFIYQGWLISILGTAAGVVIGLALCLCQQYLGIIKLGDGTDYIISAYPVEVQALDILLVVFISLLIGFITAHIPTKSLRHAEQ